MRILAGDIGGTKTWIQLGELDETTGMVKALAKKRYISKDFVNAGDLVHHFLDEIGETTEDVGALCFAVAGPVKDGAVKLTNLPWGVSETVLSQKLGIAKVKLINDFHANCYGVDALSDEDMYVLQKGVKKAKGHRAIIGAGTGLGIAIMAAHSDATGDARYEIIPTEGGHVDFAPNDDTQMELLTYMRRKYHRVSSERLLSGAGLEHIYKFVRDNPLFHETENPDVQLAMHREDPAAVISHFAIEKQDPMAMRAMDIFVRIYGAQAGNLALTCLPYGGLYIVSGIAPKILSQLTDGRFMESFLDKGRMAGLTSDIPLYVVLDPTLVLKGAACCAASLLTTDA